MADKASKKVNKVNKANKVNKVNVPTPSSDGAEYALTAAREAELVEEIHALGAAVVQFPGRLRDRVRSATRVRIAAERDAGELVKAPFFGEPPLTGKEIAAQRDHIEMLRLTESRFQKVRNEQTGWSVEFRKLADEAAAHKETLLRAFDLRFRGDPAGQKRVAQIRQGEGDADLVQDVSDIVTLCQDHMEYLASCPRGEAEAAKRLAALSPKLSHLLGAKTFDNGARRARELRDGAYTLVQATERRIRAAADYWYGGTAKMKEYAAYVAPAGAAIESDEAIDPPAPAPEKGAPANGAPA